MEPAIFFPVTTTPLAMRAGLQPFGVDFGNGERDAHFFLRDSDLQRYQRAKQAIVDDRHVVVADSDAQRAVHRAALEFVRDRLRAEHDVALPALTNLDDDRSLTQR